MKRWTLCPFGSIDKRIALDGPGPLRLEVDYDDVDHEQVERDTRALVEKLNAPDTKFTRLALLEAVQKLLDDERTGLNKDHTLAELMSHLDDPTTTVEL